MHPMKLAAAAITAFTAILGASGAWASQPTPWQMTFQPAATPIMERVTAFNELVFWIILVITLFVLALLLFIVVRFRASANPVPSKTTHNTVLEVLWTVIPIVILIVIAIPSFKLLYYIDEVPESELTIKVVGHQWYWSYEYPDHEIAFDSNMIPEDELKAGQIRLLEVDNRVMVPVATNVRIIMTADDVIHAWSVPAFGIKFDTVPGRLAETWIHVNKEGVYYGQCSELCGTAHSKMPIAVEAVSKAKFEAWLKEAKVKFATAPASREFASEQPLVPVQ
jgi:cytochrome c oxidase subunit 2